MQQKCLGGSFLGQNWYTIWKSNNLWDLVQSFLVNVIEHSAFGKFGVFVVPSTTDSYYKKI